ncbi:MAG: M28 family peptidase [Alphaproteobacteria bacterium]|nr:M28 family peptidase [Alphaproteobacteria bacterium]
MKILIAAAAAVCLAHGAAAQAPTPTPIPEAVQEALDTLRTRALASDEAYRLAESLTTEVGPRLAGTAAEERARAWAVAQLRARRFEMIRIEGFAVPHWRAVRQEASVSAPAPQPLRIVALGGSAATPEGGLEADVVRFASLGAFRDAAPSSVVGRIVFVDEGMIATMDGSGYGAAVPRRSACPRLAREKGAAACVIRSVGTDEHRFPHQGTTLDFAAGTGVPAAALSNPDADQIARLIARGPVRMRLDIAVERDPAARSGNVIAEIRGRSAPDEIVLLAAHLDSWDEGTGAIDDAAGVGIIIAAADLIRQLPRRPRRTIRLLIAGAEETGVFGGAEYARVHAGALAQHVLALESDFGAGRIWRFRSRFGAGAAGHHAAMAQALRAADVMVSDTQPAFGGADIAAVRAAGVPVIDLGQNGLDYFDYHHTADDTFDKIDPANMRQNVAAWAIAAYLAAEMDWDFRAAE